MHCRGELGAINIGKKGKRQSKGRGLSSQHHHRDKRSFQGTARVLQELLFARIP